MPLDGPTVTDFDTWLSCISDELLERLSVMLEHMKDTAIEDDDAFSYLMVVIMQCLGTAIVPVTELQDILPHVVFCLEFEQICRAEILVKEGAYTLRKDPNGPTFKLIA